MADEMCDFGQISLPCLGKRVRHDIVPHIGSHRTGTIVKRMPTWENKVSIAITRVGWIEAATDDDAWTTWQRKYDLTSWFGALSIIRNQTLHCRVCSLVLNMQITIRQNHNYLWNSWLVIPWPEIVEQWWCVWRSQNRFLWWKLEWHCTLNLQLCGLCWISVGVAQSSNGCPVEVVPHSSLACHPTNIEHWPLFKKHTTRHKYGKPALWRRISDDMIVCTGLGACPSQAHSGWTNRQAHLVPTLTNSQLQESYLLDESIRGRTMIYLGRV